MAQGVKVREEIETVEMTVSGVTPPTATQMVCDIGYSKGTILSYDGDTLDLMFVGVQPAWSFAQRNGLADIAADLLKRLPAAMQEQIAKNGGWY